MDTTVSSYWRKIQASLFPSFCDEVGQTSEKHRQVMVVLDVARIEDLVSVDPYPLGPGRPPIDRAALARAFVAKAVLNLPTTRALLDRLSVDPVLRRICGFEGKKRIASEATFSNAFAEFAHGRLAERVHEALVRQEHVDVPVHHISRDSTSIEAREKPLNKFKARKEKSRRGRPKKGEVRPAKELPRLERQLVMSLDEQLADLPKDCDFGAKLNGKGMLTGWIGFKLHIDTADGGVPITCILTSASVHDSAVSLPLEELTSRRVKSLYSVMDAAYDAPVIRDDIESRGKTAIIDHNPRRSGEKKEFDPPKKRRFKVRTEAERVNANLKDDYGARFVRVKGAAKVMSHLMFGVLALTAMRLVQLG